jgi:hypothetical protein
MGLMVSYFFNIREVGVHLYIGNIKNLQLSRSSLIPNEHYQFRLFSIESEIIQNLYGFVAIISYIFFVMFGSAGFSFFGAQMLKKYLFQPTLPKPEEHVLAKTVLRETSEKIIEKGRMVYSINDDIKQNRHKMTKVEADTKMNIMTKKIREIKEDSDELKEMLDIFEKEGDYASENPLVYIVYGSLGILSYILGVFFVINNYYLLQWYFQMTDNTYYYMRIYLGQSFIYITLLIVYIMVLIAIVYGYSKMSTLTPDYIMRDFSYGVDVTWTDEFHKLSNFLMLASSGVLMGMVRQFPTVFAGTGFFQVYYLNLSSVYPYNNFIYGNYPNVIFIIFYMVGFFIVFFESAPKEKLEKLLKEKKEELKEKQEAIKENGDMI